MQRLCPDLIKLIKSYIPPVKPPTRRDIDRQNKMNRVLDKIRYGY